MSDERQPIIVEPKAESPAIAPDIVSPTQKKSNKKIWIIAGIVLAVLCICSILCVTLTATGIGKAMIERSPVEATLDTFMKHMEAKDIESAFDLFSPRAQGQTPIADLEKLVEGNNYVLFEGYESLSLQNLNLSAAAYTNPDMPQGTVANVTAIVSYAGGFTGSLTAVLEKVDGEWRLFNFQAIVPPDKFQP